MKKLFYLVTMTLIAVSAGAANLIGNADCSRQSPVGLPLGWELRGGGPENCRSIPGGVRLTAGGETLVLVYNGLRLEDGKEYILRARAAGVDLPAEWRAYCEWTAPRPDGSLEWYASPVEWRNAVREGEEFKATFTFVGSGAAHLAVMVKARGAVDVTGLELAAVEAQPEKTGLGGRWTLAGEAAWREADGPAAFAIPGGSSAACRGIRLEAGTRYRLDFETRGMGREDNMAEYVPFRVEIDWAGGERTQAPWDDTWNSSFQGKSFIFTVPAGCDGVTAITVSAQAPGVVFRNFALEAAPPSAEETHSLRFDAPVWRDGIYASMPAGVVTGRVAGTGAVTALALRLFDGDREVWRENFDSERFSIPVAELAYGGYRLRAEFDGAVVERELHKRPPAPVEVIQDAGLNFRINGEPFWPVLLWESPGGEGLLRYAAARGFNLVLGGRAGDAARTLEGLEQCRKAGVMAMLNIGFPERIDGNGALLWEHRLYGILTPEVLAHPALFGYYLADEPYWGGVRPEKLFAGYDALKKIDPYRPVWINAAPRGSVEVHRVYSRAADIYGVDIYPVPYPNGHSALEDKMMSAVGGYARRMLDATGHGKAIWMTLQGFSWYELDGSNPGQGYPTPAELRYMAFDAIVSGATGVAYWGVNQVKAAGFFEDLFRQTDEMHLLGPLLAGGLRKPAAATADAPQVRVLALEHSGALYLIAINDKPEAVRCRIAAPFGGDRVTVFGENRELPAAGGSITDQFAGYGVHLYGTAPLPAASPLPQPGGNPYPGWLAERLNAPRYRGEARWIWHADLANVAESQVVLRREISCREKPAAAELMMAADNYGAVYVNGTEAGRIDGWTPLKRLNIAPLLQSGRNLIEIRAADGGGLPCGIIGEIMIAYADGSRETVLTDAAWLAAPEDAADFEQAHEIAKAGSGVWGDQIEMPK